MNHLIFFTIFVLISFDAYAKSNYVTCPSGTQFKKVDTSQGWGHTFGYGCDKEMKDGSYSYHGPYVETRIVDGQEVVIIKGNYIEGKKSGKWILDGKKPKKEDEWNYRVGYETYSNDELNGPSEFTEHISSLGKTDYHYIQNYKNGQKTGISLTYFSNDKKQLKEKVQFVNDEMDGECVRYYENGKVWEQGSYKNGKQVGVWTSFFENGRKMTQGEYKNGEKNGVWSTWDAHGQITKQTWNKGNPKWN